MHPALALNQRHARFSFVSCLYGLMIWSGFARRTTRTLRCGVWVLVIGCLSACGSTEQAGRAGGDRNVIKQEQIQQVGTSDTAYSLVKRLRPNWLRKRGVSSISAPSDIVVYVEGSRRGGPPALRNVRTLDVASLHFLAPREATLRYGSGHDHGAIQVELKER